MADKTKFWIIITSERYHNILAPFEYNPKTFEVEPTDKIKKGDIAYVWSMSDKCFCIWGTIPETPKIEIIASIGAPKRRREHVTIDQIKELMPPITAQVMRTDRRLKDWVPDDHYPEMQALPLDNVRANHLNDFIREHNIEAPIGSATTRWTIPDDAPLIIMQTLLTFGDKTKEGQLVEAVRFPWEEMLELIKREPNEIYNIDPWKFEEFIAGAWKKRGYEVELTPRSGDKGRDVIVTIPGVGGIRIFDQIKRYKISRPVTLQEVSSLVGTLTMAGNVSKGMVTTTSTFAPKIYENNEVTRLMPWRLELRPRDALLSWLNDIPIVRSK